MALLNVTNDLRTPVEVRLWSEEWELVYPKMSCDIKVADTAVTFVEIRLVESPEVKGSCQARGGSSLWASVDFDSFSRQAKGRDRAEARELAREGKRREEARKRTEAMIKEAAAKKRDKKAWSHVAATGIFAGLPFALLLVCVSIPPESTVAAALLASATVPLCCCISISSFFGTSQNEDEQFRYGKYHAVLRVGLRFVGILALLSLAAMTVQHTLRGYWWTAVIVWPVAICGGVMFCVCCFIDVEMDDEQRKTLEREREEAHCEVSNRSIRFEGSVLCEPGRPCVASWPGKYEGAWESLVSQGRNGEVSAAVVFLPQGTEDYGQCDSIPEAEGLPGTCWCTPLYGEQKPWGCRWFTKWRENIETAVESGAELEVYYFQRHVGKGKVESFESAGKDNLQRERVNKKQKEFEESPPFEQALNAGLGNLSKDPRGDGSSQYSREVRRLFLASLPEAEREFITSAEGLGNSQKAEVAWLEKKGYEYWGVDVSTWLPGEGVEICVPASAEWQAQVCDVSPISVSVAKE